MLIKFKKSKGYKVITIGNEKHAFAFYQKHGIAIRQVSTEGGKMGVYEILVNK